MEANSEYAVQMHGITKVFGTFKALDGVDLDVRKQSVHAILGENGAGKSTLMNVLYGLYSADEGEVFLNGKHVDISNPNDAIAQGIGMVHQHFMLVDNFTVTENIVLGDEVTSFAGVLDPKKAREKVLEIVNEYGFDVDPDAKIEDITVGMQQRVEILKALYRGADTLILDEPTAVLTPQEIEKLIQIMRDLVSKGKTIIIITHKLKEIMSSADECTIIRRGKYMGTVDVSKTNETELANKMVGRNVNLHVDKKPAKPGEVLLSIRDLHVKDERGIEQVNGLNLEVRAGEIVGLAGIDGNGQRELADAINALVKPESGTIAIRGEEIQATTPRNVINHSVATIPSDRQRWGLVLPFSVAENTVLERHGEERFGKGISLDYSKVNEFAKELVEEFDIRPAGCFDHAAGGLSGGNQQKVIIAREVSGEPDVLIAIQPTRGLDVGAIEFVHKALIRERDRGAAILLISLELDEVMDVSD
ncbi:MAG: ABC transporter ATP-binding protein, partial [Lancefieldella rimae]